MEFNPTAAGGLLIALGLLAFFAAHDVVTAIPGNLLFFTGVLTLTWGSSNALGVALFNLAAFSLVFVLGCVLFLMARTRREANDQSYEPANE